jgi:hypothetical protein
VLGTTGVFAASRIFGLPSATTPAPAKHRSRGHRFFNQFLRLPSERICRAIDAGVGIDGLSYTPTRWIGNDRALFSALRDEQVEPLLCRPARKATIHLDFPALSVVGRLCYLCSRWGVLMKGDPDMRRRRECAHICRPASTNGRLLLELVGRRLGNLKLVLAD